MMCRDESFKLRWMLTKSASPNNWSRGRKSAGGAPGGGSRNTSYQIARIPSALHVACYLPPDAPESDHADRLPGDVVSERRSFFAAGPRTAAYVALVLAQPPSQHEDQRHG